MEGTPEQVRHEKSSEKIETEDSVPNHQPMAKEPRREVVIFICNSVKTDG
jgi:hypothetical protein